MHVSQVLTGVLLGAVLLTGCTGGDTDQSTESAAADSDTSGSATGGSGALEPAAEAAGEAGGEAGGGSATSTVTDLRVAPGVALIRTAELEVRVDDVQRSAEEAARLAREAGGRVESEDRSGSGGDRSASVQLRVPADRFDAVLADLSGLGDERSRRVSSEDVGDQVVDLGARLATQRASVERVRALLDEADALGQVVQIEGELTRRTADLESLQARLQALEGAVSLSTVVLQLHSEDGPVVGDALGFGDGLRSGWAAVVGVGRVLAVTSGALLPFLPVLALGGWLVLRRGRRSRSVGTSLPAASAP